MILALDLGTHCGWSLRDEAAVVDSGVWDFTPRKGEAPITRPARFHGRLRGMLATYNPDQVAYEAINNLRGLDAVRCYLQLETVLLLELAYRNDDLARKGMRPIAVTPLSPAAVKKHATGKGNADKTAMAVAAARRWPGWTPAREDEVDARFVGEAAAAGVKAPERRRRARRTLGEAA